MMWDFMIYLFSLSKYYNKKALTNDIFLVKKKIPPLPAL